MFFANDMYGKKIHINYAEVGGSYFCPGCGAAMIQKRGNINVHHFAHKAGKECDPWYTGKLSSWHIKMQQQFDKSAQEVVVWNKMHTEYHIADIALQTNHGKFIIEFQHSTISQKEFISRSSFYIECGYILTWVFDFCECDSYKRIFVSEEYDDNMIHLVWPGHDRIKFLDNIDFTGCSDNLYIFFHISTGKGKLCRYDSEGYCPWTKWEYVDPLSKCPCFALLSLNTFSRSDDFFAKYYSERDFYRALKNLGR